MVAAASPRAPVVKADPAKPKRKARVSRAGDAEEAEIERLVDELRTLLDWSDGTAPGGDDELAGVRIHTDAAADHAARALNARAFVLGDHIFFAAGQYAPTTTGGDRLLLHELLHVLRGRALDEPVIFRQETVAEPAPADTSVAMGVTLDGIVLDFGVVTYRAGRTRMQFLGLLLRRLLGPAYRAGLEASVLEKWAPLLAAANLTMINALREDNTAREGQRIGRTAMNGLGVLLLIRVLEQDMGLHVALSDAQRELLQLGVSLTSAWTAIRPLLPDWYTPFMFRREMAQHAGLARRWLRVEQGTQDEKDAVIDEIFGRIHPPAFLLEQIRLDYQIANEILRPRESDSALERRNRDDAFAGYISLWPVTVRAAEPLTQPPPARVRSEEHAFAFLSFMHTQPQLMEAASNPDNHEARVDLVARFGRFSLRLFRRAVGDERLLTRPARANATAWDAEMSSFPPLQPPLYDAALETDHAFTMQLQWGHWTDAFAAYRYRWEFMKVPNTPPGAPAPDMTMAAGERPDPGTVLDTRLARARRYNVADIERIRRSLGGVAFGPGITDIIALNNALRIVGVYIRDFTERITQPSYTARIVFPSSGIYVVRCRAVPVLAGDEEVVRAPSVALLPVVARDPDEMAISRAQEAKRTEFRVRLRIAEIQSLLAAPFPPENAAALQAELDELQAMLVEPGDALERQRNILRDQVALLARRVSLRNRIAELSRAEQPDQEAIAGLRRELARLGGEASSPFEERELRDLESRLGTLNDMIATRDARRTRAGVNAIRMTPYANFVSDLGASIALALEVYDRGEVDGHYEVFISDLTTPDSGEAIGTSPTAGVADPQAAAILDGVRTLLENSSDYGRGRVAIYVGSTVHTLRIEAGSGRLLSEAVESGVTVLSLAAIIAAPFTEGASLYLLLPLGAIGAVPSAYRLYQRHEESRLRLDLAAVMDVVNVVAGVIGLAHAATPLRMVRMGRVLMVMGIGADGSGILLMGAGIVVQLDELRNLPEHERAARMLEIIGNAMLQIGIQAGGMLAHAHYQGHRTASAGESEPHVRVPTEEPGFHPPSGDITPVPRDATSTPADRTMSGSSRTPPGNVPPARPHAASPERLFAELERGVDPSRRPASQAGEVQNPPPAGEFRRNLRTAEAAYQAYNEALAVSNGREVGIYHNPQTGEYRVMLGTETGVRGPAGHGWNTLLHFHPIPEGTLTFRLPAPQDFMGLMIRFVSEGVHVREFIEFDIADVGRGRTEYGIDPNHAEPFYVRIHYPDGTSRTVRFAHDGAYHAYWGERTVYVEPGSPTYDAMIRDIQDFVRSLEREGGADFGPAARTPGERSVAGSTARTSAPLELQTGQGDLTPAGIDVIRRRFRSIREGNRSISLESLTDAQIAERFPNQPNWLEAIVLAEARAQWMGRSTATDFVMTNPRQNLNDVAARLRDAIDAGNTGHSLHTEILSWSVWDFVREMVAQNDPTLAPAFNALENLPNTPANRELIRRWREFKTSTTRGDMSGFFLGTVGSKRPDIVEVSLSGNAIHVTDASFAHGDPIHNFKSAFYRTVIERLINVDRVTATDYRAPLRQTPVGP